MLLQDDIPGLPPAGATCRLGTLSTSDGRLVAEWPFPIAAAMGSTLRVKGIHRETKAALPAASRQLLSLEEGVFRIVAPEAEAERFAEAVRLVETILVRASDIPVLPTEVEEILNIGARERLKWTKDGRLRSAGTRTVRMRGRSRTVTFHVHDPRHVEDVLDRDLPTIWREEDEAERIENRRRGAGRAAATRAAKSSGAQRSTPGRSGRVAVSAAGTDPEGWKAFFAEGLLS